jgi:hypothetical protein
MPVLRRLPLLALLLCAACATTPPEPDIVREGNRVIVHADPGGSVRERLLEIDLLEMQNKTVQIEGWCASACTLYLGMDTTCVAPNALLGFHGPRGRKPNGREYTYDPDTLELAIVYMAREYPAYLQDWFITTGSRVQDDLLWIRGENLAKIGAPLC